MLSLFEKKTENYLAVRIPEKTSKAVMAAMEMLKAEYGDRFAQVFFAHPYTSWERAENECHNDLFRAFVPKGTSMEDYSAKDILRVADELNVDSGKSWAMQPRRSCLTPSLTGRTRQIATSCQGRGSTGILDSSSRACCTVAESGFRRTIFIHAGVQLALSICASEGKRRSSQLF